ncbi:hypothetical protein C8F04DRAFT_557998 [Mycena alexandri]|uniref:Uncharacterized protein n=1 Tax=Mycena alexandri TaxID=1745969 RepID=A0AAD6SWC6_9AGAR|nr:hypothetical protein C8F04DRAFT_557998 [Mycena alexandri]
MAVPLAQISLNIPPALNQNGFVSGIPIPPAPANPPNAVDVKAAVKLKAAVAHELVLNSPIPDAVVEAVANYETDVILARQIALAPQPALPAPGPGLAAAVAPPAPAGPSRFIIFVAPAHRLSAPMAGVALILNAIAASNQALGGRLDLIDRKINDIQRDIAIVSLRQSGIQEN